MIIKCFAMYQPFATLAIEGLKEYETRWKYSAHRGITGIHATADSPAWCKDLFYTEPFYSRLKAKGYNNFHELPTAGVLGILQVKEWLKIIHWGRPPLHPKVEINITTNTVEKEFGDWTPGRYAILLREPVKFKEKVFARGTQNLLFDAQIPDELCQ